MNVLRCVKQVDEEKNWLGQQMWNQDKVKSKSVTSGEAEKCIDNIRVTQPYMLYIALLLIVGDVCQSYSTLERLK